MTTCLRCSSEVGETEEKCSTCGAFAGPPNVRAAEKLEEQVALERRYDEAVSQSYLDGSDAALMSFDVNMELTFAVVNVDIDFLRQFVTSDKMTFSNYDLSVKGQIRKSAEATHDRHRRTIGAMLFGGYSEHIRYAALSLDGGGLQSYGAFAIKLRQISIANRATLLEDNSYNFIAKHKLQGGEEIPPGYVAKWDERHKLAVSKLAKTVSAGTSEAEHPKILLRSTGDRNTDECIEVHIYGGFDNKAIESVRGKSPTKGKYEIAAISLIKDCLNQSQNAWIEE
ncbi:MAG TPA: hypothetical protein VLL54_11045 [Pyrinomonadaceae bacterium]|nr:hypothetical protein [Pyrinomonadaceae bacterium]